MSSNKDKLNIIIKNKKPVNICVNLMLNCIEKILHDKRLFAIIKRQKEKQCFID